MENQGYCRCQDYRISTEDRHGCWMVPAWDYRQVEHAVGGSTREVGLSKPFGAQIMRGFYRLDTKLFKLLGFGIHFDKTVTMPWFYFLEIRTCRTCCVCVCVFTVKNWTFKIIKIFKDCGTFKILLYFILLTSGLRDILKRKRTLTVSCLCVNLIDKQLIILVAFYYQLDNNLSHLKWRNFNWRINILR